MRQQPITEDSWSEAEAMRLVRSFGTLRSRDGAGPAALPGNGPADDGTPSPGERRRNVLTRTVLDEVIPRLLLAHRPQDGAPQTAVPASSAQAEELVGLVLHGTASEAVSFVEGVRQGGVSIEGIYLGLITSAARRLGVMWEDDDCTFSDVTLGTLRLRNLVRLMGRAFCGEAHHVENGPSTLLVQMPGEQHGLGLAMMVQFFRRAGWNVRDEPVVTSAELIALVEATWFGMVGISVGCNDKLDRLAADIREIRKRARNPKIGILVGGAPFVAHPQLATMVGADATALDARQAVHQAQSLLSMLARDP